MLSSVNTIRILNIDKFDRVRPTSCNIVSSVRNCNNKDGLDKKMRTLFCVFYFVITSNTFSSLLLLLLSRVRSTIDTVSASMSQSVGDRARKTIKLTGIFLRYVRHCLPKGYRHGGNSVEKGK